MLVGLAYMGIGPTEETPYDDLLIAEYYTEFRRSVRMQFYPYMDEYVIGRHLCSIELPSGWDFLVHRHNEFYVALEVFPIL